MAKTIDQLTSATALSGADEVPVFQGGVTKKATVTQIGASLPSPSIPTTTSILIGNNAGGASSIASTTLRGISTEVYMAVRTDGKAGTGTAEDPLDCGGSTALTAANKFDAILNAAVPGTHFILQSQGGNPTVFYTKGNHDGVDTTYECKGLPYNCVLSGQGKHITTLRLAQYPSAFFATYPLAGKTWNTFSTAAAPSEALQGGVTIEKLTIDAGTLVPGGTSVVVGCIAIEGSNNTVRDVRILNAYGHTQECFAALLTFRGTPTGPVTNNWYIDCEASSPMGDFTNAFCFTGYNDSTAQITNSGLINCRVTGAWTNSASNIVNGKNIFIRGNTINITSNGFGAIYNDTGANDGLQIEGNYISTDGIGVMFNGSPSVTNLRVAGNVIVAASHGVYLAATAQSGITITGNTITVDTTVDHHAITVAGGGTNVDVVANTVLGGWSGISVGQSWSGVHITGNAIYPSAFGIRAESTGGSLGTSWLIDRNHIVGAGTDGISLGNATPTAFVLQNNHIVGAGRYGINGGGASGNSFIGNTINSTSTEIFGAGTNLQRNNRKLDGTVVGTPTPLTKAEGGSGTATPSLVAGSNIAITGSWPNQTVTGTGSGSGTGVTSIAFVNGGGFKGTIGGTGSDPTLALRLGDASDTSKTATFDCSSITTSTNRAIKVPDALNLVIPQAITAGSHTFLTALDATSGLFSGAQPGFSDIGGSIAGSQLPPSTLNPPFVTLSDGATVTIACSATKVVQNHVVTIAANRQLAFSGLANGMSGVLQVIQGAGGSHSLTLPAGSKVVNGGGGAVTLSTIAGSIDFLAWLYDGVSLFVTSGTNFS